MRRIKWIQIIVVLILISFSISIFIFSFVNREKIKRTIETNNKKEYQYIGGDIGDGGIGYTVERMTRYDKCYEVFYRGKQAFSIKVDCKDWEN